MSGTAPIGHNRPPEPTPFEAGRELVSQIETEATAWFDGASIGNDAQADEVSRIIDAARKAAKKLDDERKAEKQPHSDAAKAVDEKWKPLLADIERIASVAKRVLTPWLMAKEAEKRERGRIEAEKAAAAAEEARRLAEQADGSLAAAKARDAAIEEAKAAEARAAAAGREKAGAKGSGMARAVSLRTTYRAAVADRRALLNHIAKHDPEGLGAWCEQWAQAAVRAGARNIPGIEVHEEKAAA